jgi:CheY-like chemotaxis protein
LERVNSHIEIIVSDTGSGIKPEFLPYVFDRFRQADSSSTRKIWGMGLGLSIVRQLVELHGGSVAVESPGEGQGATFIVKLPVLISRTTAISPARVHPVAEDQVSLSCPPQLEELRILAVDDDPDARDLLTTILTECGADVKTAASVQAALQILQEPTWQPDVLISDIEMPEADGYSLIRAIRAQEQNGTMLPAIALTAYARAEDRLRALSAGFQMHVPKPVEPAELLTVVASLAGRLAQQAGKN